MGQKLWREGTCFVYELLYLEETVELLQLCAFFRLSTIITPNSVEGPQKQAQNLVLQHLV